MKKGSSPEMADLMESVDASDELKTRKTGESNHELAEADADDISIKNKVGGAELDEDLPGSDQEPIPYAKDFLLKKNTKRMQFWVEYFTKHQRDRFQRFINNGEEYRHHIENIFVQYGLPKDLYFVGLIESGYYLGAKSHASAVGPWQFIKGTGKRYGLKISHEIDERQDLFKASKAAAMYFKDLHNVFSSWELALAAYNAGEYGIIRRIMKSGTRDFYKLSKNKQLPSETINYVPKVLAAMHVVNNAAKYGFIIPKKKHRLFDETELRAFKRNTSLQSIAQRLGVKPSLIKKLNPELKRNATPRFYSGVYYLRIPRGQYAYKLEELNAPVIDTPKVVFSRPESRKEFNRRVANVIEKKEQVKVHHNVKRGDTLTSIARKYKTTPKLLAELNELSSWKSKVRIGQRLTIHKKDIVTPKVKISNRPIVYKVKAGDNLTDLARIFKLKISKIKKVNKLKQGQIMVGQKIVLPNTQKGIYVVRPGDHLTKVARDLNQPMEALVKLNSLNKKKIYPGQKIIVNMD